jgi:hypothetical protein
MHERPVSAEIQVPVVRVEWEAFLLDPPYESIVVVLALRSANDLTVAFRRETVVT